MALENKSSDLLIIVLMKHDWATANPAIALLAAVGVSREEIVLYILRFGVIVSRASQNWCHCCRCNRDLCFLNASFIVR